MEESNKYINVLRIFLIIFFILSLKIAKDALFKTIFIEKGDDYNLESKMLRKKLIKNTAFMNEIVKLCKDTGYLPKDFLTTLRDEYSENFKKLNELKSKHIELEIDLTVNNEFKNYVNFQLFQDSQNSKLSIKDYCEKYDFNNLYNLLDENIIEIKF